MPTNNNNSYELTYILGETTKPDEAKTKLETIKKSIATLGGKTSREEVWGRRELAYPIKRNRSGIYTTVWFELPATQAKELDHQLRFDEEIIRTLVTKAVEYSQPGSLAPVEEETTASPTDDKATAEALIRRHSAANETKEPAVPTIMETENDLPEEERLKKLDEKLDELLAEEE